MQKFIRDFLTAIFILTVTIPVNLAAGAVKLPILDGTSVPATDYPYVGLITVNDFGCTGTLISSRHVLSAAHCFFDDNNQRVTDLSNISVTLNNQVYGVSKVTLHSSYVSRDEACLPDEVDASLIELSQDVSGISPIPLNRSAPAIGNQLLLVGFGVQGTGQSGEDDTFPGDGYVNYGYTTVESVDGTYANWTFDAGASESNTGGGDSGGPAFLDINGQRYIDSITCGGTGNAGFTTTSSNTRADILAPWVDSVVSGTNTGGSTGTLGVDSVVVNLYDEDAYTLLVKGKLTTAKAIAPNKLAVKLGTAGVNTSVRLDRNGAWRNRSGWDYFKFAGKLSGGKFTSSKVSYNFALGDANKIYNKLSTVFPEDAANGDIVQFTLQITVNKVAYSKTVNMKYNASTGVWKSVK